MNIEWDRKALDELARSSSVKRACEMAAVKVQEQAKANVTGHYAGTKKVKGIVTQSGTDTDSAYADVGYDKTHPGFVLWWSEVGTQKMSPRPHLRAALNQVRL